MTTHTQVSKRQISGHLRRAQARVSKAMRGRGSEDVMVQAAVAAVGAGVVLRLLRFTPISRLIASVAPMLVFAAIYSRSAPAARSSH